MLKNGQTSFKKLVLFTPQDFYSMPGHIMRETVNLVFLLLEISEVANWDCRSYRLFEIVLRDST